MPNTPILNLPYPVGTDWVADGALNIENLANGIDTAFQNLGYIGRNVLINGNFQIWQRGTTITGVNTNAVYLADQWANYTSGGPTINYAQESSILPVGAFYALKATVGTGAAPLAGGFLYLGQKLEAANVQSFLKGTDAALPFCLSFWVRSSITGVYIAELVDEVNTRSVSAAYTIAAADTWQKVILEFPTETVNKLTYSTNAGLSLNLWLQAGTNFTSGTLQETWGAVTSSKRAVGQVAWATTTSNTFYVANVQLEPAFHTAFEQLDISIQLLRALRYFWRDTKTASGQTFGQGFNTSTTVGNFLLQHPVTMRAAPVLTFNNATTFAIRYLATTANTTAISSITTSKNNSTVSATVGAVLTAGQGSRLAANAATWIQMSAEL